MCICRIGFLQGLTSVMLCPVLVLLGSFGFKCFLVGRILDTVCAYVPIIGVHCFHPLFSYLRYCKGFSLLGCCPCFILWSKYTSNLDVCLLAQCTNYTSNFSAYCTFIFDVYSWHYISERTVIFPASGKS